jgi:hypothetical protein
MKRLMIIVLAMVMLYSFSTTTFAENILATLTIDGYYIGTEVGDYVHTNIKTIHGDKMSFWGNNDLMPFLEKNRGKLIRFTYQIVDEYIPEGRTTKRIEVLKKAKVIK